MPLLAPAADADEIILAAILRQRLREAAARVARDRAQGLDAGPSASDLEGHWARWLLHLFGPYFRGRDGAPIPFAPHMADLWEWVWAIIEGEEPPAFVAIWSRGGGKSTNGELVPIALGALGTRRYFVYVCETQEQADDHVQTIAHHLESATLGAIYPGLGARMIGKYGSSRGWRRNRLRTAAGLTIDALGLDTASRGMKIEGDRPDGFIFDDIDDDLDTPGAVDRKASIISRRILPAGAPAVAVLFLQNLIHHQGVVARLAGLADKEADFLHRRIVSGPHKALEGLIWERIDAAQVPEGESPYRVTHGAPAWAGQGIAECQTFINRFGLRAFLAECQHEDVETLGGLFDHVEFRRMAWEAVPWGEIVRTTVWVDPAVTAKDSSDSHGIQADALASDGVIYRLYSFERRATPEEALERAILKAIEVGSPEVGVETDQGGDAWRSVYAQAVLKLREGTSHLGRLAPDQAAPRFIQDKASSMTTAKAAKTGATPAPRGSTQMPKAARASLMLPDYERGRIVHVYGGPAGASADLIERALRRFPKKKPFDLVDVSFWAWHHLRNPVGAGIIAQGRVRGAESAFLSPRRSAPGSRPRPGLR